MLAAATPQRVLPQNIVLASESNVRRRHLTVRFQQRCPHVISSIAAGFRNVPRSLIRASSVTTNESEAASPTVKPQALQDVTIVGGGIAGLATALALNRLGIRALLLEQSEQLRTEGSAIGVWSNAWKALDALGVADGLRGKFDRLTGLEILSKDGKFLANMNLLDAERDIEFRAVDRKSLLEALKKALPDGIVFNDAQVVRIQKLRNGYTEVECKNGWKIKTKVLIGCDGVGSIVGKWMGFEKPKYAGYTAIRGLATFPDGHKLKPVATQMIGEGVRAGIVTMDRNQAYWFVVFNSSGQEKISDTKLIRQESLKYVRGWPQVINDMINNSPLDTFSRRAIADRWMWPVGGPSMYQGGVTLAGDAMHPITPNLGQGGCCALEDAVVLGRLLGNALLKSKELRLEGQSEMEKIELALKNYTEERWPRMLPIAIRSYIIGAVMQQDNTFICTARNTVIPKLLTVDRFTSHTSYDCGTLTRV